MKSSLVFGASAARPLSLPLCSSRLRLAALQQPSSACCFVATVFGLLRSDVLPEEPEEEWRVVSSLHSVP